VCEREYSDRERQRQREIDDERERKTDMRKRVIG